MDRVQGVSQEIPAEMNMGRDFARGLALLWKEWSSILVQGEKIRRSHEKDYLVSSPRGTAIHAGGKLLVATHSAPQKVRGEAYCIVSIDASEHSYGVYQDPHEGRFLLKEACSEPPFRPGQQQVP